ncbi:hypothetical protein ACIQAL_03415, partial [Pseudomonas sp. NPDC088368]|uniref:hypothetical protein n=1 Tax=Pseudomonas sp. NPDC088368 TaxID=3364453 RepID=UPI00380F69FC
NPDAVRAKPGAGPFWLLLWLLTKVTRRKGGTVISHYRSIGSTHHSKILYKPDELYNINCSFLISRL